MSLYQAVQKQIKESFSYISEEFNEGLLERILHPDQVIEFPVTIKLDNGKTKTFTAYRSQHNNVKGPYKGGLRFHPQVSKDEVMSLSAWMSLKTSVVGLPLGWGKWGIIVDPKELSQTELEKLSRKFMQKLAPYIWPQIDVPAPDVNTNPQIMAWMVDEYSKLVGQRTPGVITGKPVSIGGSQGRWEATALGGFYTLEAYLAEQDKWVADQKIIIQWVGNVGLNFAEIVVAAGAKIIGISDSKGNVFDPNGLDISKIIELKSQRKTVTKYQWAQDLPEKEFLLQQCDILVPAALENQITQENAEQIKAKIILEMANGPTTYDADTILQNKNIPVIPDVLANAWGVTVSYFEQVQNNTNYYWPKDEVYTKLENIMKSSTLEVLEAAKKYKTNLRTAAYIVSLKRILTAMKLRS